MRYSSALLNSLGLVNARIYTTNMAKIPDINDNELWIVKTTLMERYGEKKEVQIVDAEARLFSSDQETTECPGIYWHDNDCNFLIAKTGEGRYRAQFFYRAHEHYGCGTDEYDDLAICIVSLLQTQAGHGQDTEKKRNNTY